MPLVPVLSERRASPVLPDRTPSNNNSCLATRHRKSPCPAWENRRRLAEQSFFLPPPTARSSPESSCLLMVAPLKYEGETDRCFPVCKDPETADTFAANQHEHRQRLLQRNVWGER